MNEHAEERPLAMGTGAAGGIGSAICHELGRRGDLVVACDRDSSKLQAFGGLLAREENQRVTRMFDVAPGVACEEEVAWLGSELGRLDALVNIDGGQPAEERL